MRLRPAIFIAFVFAYFFFKFHNNGDNQKLKAWSLQLRKNPFCMLNIQRPIAHQSSITFFLIHPVQAKYKNNISYHLTICFLAQNATINVNDTTNVFFTILRDFLLRKYHKYLSSVSWKNTHKIGLHVYISLRTGVAFLGKKTSPNQNAHTTFFHM